MDDFPVIYIWVSHHKILDCFEFHFSKNSNSFPTHFVRLSMYFNCSIGGMYLDIHFAEEFRNQHFPVSFAPVSWQWPYVNELIFSASTCYFYAVAFDSKCILNQWELPITPQVYWTVSTVCGIFDMHEVSVLGCTRIFRWLIIITLTDILSFIGFIFKIIGSGWNWTQNPLDVDFVC